MACMLAAGGFLGAEPRPGAEAGRGAGPIRALLLIDEGYGGNWLARDGKPSIAESLLSFGWELELASPAGSAGPCPWGAKRGMGRLSTLRIDAIGDVLAYDLVVVLPGSKPGGLAADPAALALLKAADSGGLAIAAFCRGARVLAAAGVLEGRRMTGHPDYAEEYRAAGALYQGFEDLEGKSDA
ncbi:MAG TPA: DJ-1/PfpI family protein, partial [Spirochaetales bacterium]|nr:DJ-1/PfpI family protein [Spirochaetales bacterium]